MAANYGAIRSERSAFKAQQNCTPRKVLSDAPGEENGTLEEIDEQREWQREVGLDSLNVTALSSAATEAAKGGGTILHGSSIIQALREGMKGTQSKNYFIKKETDS